MNPLQSIVRGTVTSWQTQSPAQKILRTFLGATWVYAGWVKAIDPGFLTKGADTYIGTQLAAFAQHSPISFLLQHTLEHATLIGAFVMVSEFAIGFATLLSVAPTMAAFGGFTMSIGLWLSSSFHTSPYFLASDTAYAILWLVYLLLMIGKRHLPQANLQRRNIMRAGIIAGFAGVASLLGRAVQPSGAATGTTSSSTASKSSASPSGKQIVKLANLPVGSSFNFVHSKRGLPTIVFRTKTGVFAYSAICTHEGCTVAYKKSAKQLVCPCHGAKFDPFNGAKAIAGPTNTPLDKVKVKISGEWVVEA